jgi:glycosyltransferase involved in cell wall biosynthesis
MLKAYNHELHVAQAIESALEQETTFPFEIVVGEDSSTDRTGEIVRQYGCRHPDTIRVLERPAHVGMVRNTMDLYDACRGQYLAWLDGDDYWISRDKLQRQVEYLDAHPPCTMCFHDALVIMPDGQQSVRSLITPGRTVCTIEDFLAGPPGCSGSFLYRKLPDLFPEWFSSLTFSDWPFQVLHAARGPGGWLPDLLVAYRAHAMSAGVLGFGRPSVTLDDRGLAIRAEVYAILNRHFGFRYDRIIDTELLKLSMPAQRIVDRTWRHRELRRRVWRIVKKRPLVARWAVRLAGSLAGVLDAIERRRAGRSTEWGNGRPAGSP